MSDFIRREDAIEAILYSHLNVLTPEERKAHIEALPSADVVERKRGEWIRIDFAKNPSVMECSCCGERIWLTTFYEDRHDFCGACGADMRERKDNE